MNRFLILVAGLYLSSAQLFAAEGDTISLNEKWLFKIARNEASAPKNFESTRFNDSQWTFQTVPGVWRVPAAWTKDNYVGTYRGWVKMPPTFTGRRVFLHIGFTTAVANVYLNGEKIGQTALDRAQTEFEVTDKLKVGERNLFVFRMPHYDEGEDAENTFGRSGITSSCYVYSLPAGMKPAGDPSIGRAKSGVLVADRYSFELEEGFFDTPKNMQKDIDLMKKLGFGAITYNKLSSDPDFIAYARTQGMEVVSTAPTISEDLVDRQGNFTSAIYNLLPATAYDFKKEIKDGQTRANAAVAKAKPRSKETADLLTIWDTPYSIAFDKHTGLIASYSQNGVPVFSGGGTIMPNAKCRLVSLQATKPSKSDGTRVAVVYDVEGEGKVTWVYRIPKNGVLTVSTKGKQDLLVTLPDRMNKSEYMAQDFGQDQNFTTLKETRPRVYWVKLFDNSGKGVQVIGEQAFTAVKASKSTQVVMRHDNDNLDVTFLPVSR